MSQKCSLCGGEFAANEQCRERFELCMAMEFETPNTFGIVHHLTVLCYMLQHNEYAREVWLEARKMIALFIEQGVTPAEMRKKNQSRFESGHRTWNITKGAKLLEFDTIVWTRTIADVRFDNPEVYTADIRLWATSILADTRSLVQRLESGS